MSQPVPPLPSPEPRPLVQKIVEVFLTSHLAVLLVILSLGVGAVALVVTPREEEPQIVVPLADVIVDVPGATAREVERQVTTRLEKLLFQIDGVEYVYSMSRAGQAIVTVRFFVGEDREDSLLKLYNKLEMNADQIPPLVAGYIVKPIEIDDVPIVNITLSSDRHTPSELRRVAEELENRLQAVPDTGRTVIVGGEPRTIRVTLDPDRMAGRGATVHQIRHALAGANVTMPAGQLHAMDEAVLFEAGTVLRSAEEVGDVVVGVFDGLPVYLRDVATVSDVPAEPTSYTFFAARSGGVDSRGRDVTEGVTGPPGFRPAVTLGVAKKKGANAVRVSEAIQQELAAVAPVLVPSEVDLHITRDFGRTADEKVNELLEALLVAILIVIALIAMTLGWREALIVAVSVPITFALTLAVNYLAGYTINRVTLFALILALGLVVDAPIVDVENIYRHFKMRKAGPFRAVLDAVNEVRPPIILATLAVIVSFLPMFFITGMMGPYMRPMALNVPLAMLMSLVVAFTITPWMSYHVLKGEYRKTRPNQPGYDLHRTLLYKVYAGVMRPFLRRRAAAWALIAVTCLLFAGSGLLVVYRQVPLKMLPYDNKNEFQVLVDMPEGTPLERTAAVTREVGDYLLSLHETTDVTGYVGTASPIDFNGLVRHYQLRQEPHQADLRVNTLGKRSRVHQSHEIVLRIRNDLRAIADRHGAKLAIVETPPGPPVISTLTVEVYGSAFHDYAQLQETARIVADRLAREPGVVDVDTSVEADQRKLVFVADKEKAAVAGLSTRQLAETLAIATGGADVQPHHDPDAAATPMIRLRLPAGDRVGPDRLESLHLVARPAGGAYGDPALRVTDRDGDAHAAAPDMVQLGELGAFRWTTRDQTIYHKNLTPVVYVFGEVAGVTPAEVLLDTAADLTPGQPPDDPEAPMIPSDMRLEWAGEGEWKITVDVFRDLGLAFAAACVGIYILLVYETGSFLLPLVLMISIPLTVIGIMPGFWLLNLISDRPIGGFANPVFFTATAMIGMIALAGIAVRNAILLIDFIHAALKRGEPLEQAILDSGAVRFRPIFLTAGTAMLAAAPITLDPIFSGLAWALIFGLTVSTAFTLLLIPVIYWMLYRKTGGVPRSNLGGEDDEALLAEARRAT